MGVRGGPIGSTRRVAPLPAHALHRRVHPPFQRSDRLPRARPGPRRAAVRAAAARSKHRRVVHEGHQPFHPRRRFVAPRPAKPRVPAKRRVDVPVGAPSSQRRVRRGERVHANLAVPELGGERASERVDGRVGWRVGGADERVGSRRRERRGEPRPERGAARDEQLGAFVVGRATPRDARALRGGLGFDVPAVHAHFAHRQRAADRAGVVRRRARPRGDPVSGRTVRRMMHRRGRGGRNRARRFPRRWYRASGDAYRVVFGGFPGSRADARRGKGVADSAHRPGRETRLPKQAARDGSVPRFSHFGNA